MRAIDADALAHEILEEYGDVVKSEEVNKAIDKIYGMVINAPTITADRPTAEWILDPNGMDWNIPAWRCSRCGAKNDNIGVVAKGIASDPYRWAGSKFCPQCGCKMVAKENNDDR